MNNNDKDKLAEALDAIGWCLGEVNDKVPVKELNLIPGLTRLRRALDDLKRGL